MPTFNKNNAEELERENNFFGEVYAKFSQEEILSYDKTRRKIWGIQSKIFQYEKNIKLNEIEIKSYEDANKKIKYWFFFTISIYYFYFIISRD